MRLRPMENFIFCEQRGQRISKEVCQKNIESGTCTQTLLKCQKTRKRKTTSEKTKAEEMPKIVTGDTICGLPFLGFDSKGGPVNRKIWHDLCFITGCNEHKTRKEEKKP